MSACIENSCTLKPVSWMDSGSSLSNTSSTSPAELTAQSTSCQRYRQYACACVHARVHALVLRVLVRVCLRACICKCTQRHARMCIQERVHTYINKHTNKHTRTVPMIKAIVLLQHRAHTHALLIQANTSNPTTGRREISQKHAKKKRKEEKGWITCRQCGAPFTAFSARSSRVAPCL